MFISYELKKKKWFKYREIVIFKNTAMLLRDQVANHGFTKIKGTNDSFLY